MAQHGFAHFSAGNTGNIDPNDLYSSSFAAGNNFSANTNSNNGFSSGGAVLGDDELLDSLANPADQVQDDFSGMNIGFNQNAFHAHRGSNAGLPIDAQHMSGYSHTPDGDPIQSPFNNAYGAQFRQMGGSLHSPMSFNTELAGDSNDPNFAKARAARMGQPMQRKISSQRGTPMTPKTGSMQGMPIGSHESPAFGPQSMRASNSHDKSPPTHWLNTPNGSIPASYNSGFSSPMQQAGMGQINEVMMKGGTSMPAKLGVPNTAVSSQEMKRKRRRESHNLVERRRRDNINERIQDLSKLVPAHRLEDEKLRKLIQNGTPLSPTLTGISSPSQATSGLAGPGARRAAGASAGNITTGLPIEDKDKGPNKGDILNGSVSWTRDLMWLLHLKIQQQEELMNTIAELGGQFPFELTDDERRMQSELMDTISKNEMGAFSYTRTAGSGLRVPHHTDYRGEPINSGIGGGLDGVGITPEPGVGGGDETAQFWHDPDDDVNAVSLNFKPEDEYDLEMTQ
ncbi:Putative HLH transcription factor (GlcD gamma) [[Torrubiella] hemipterigena]|uniref:Putative HLH transcription factor (GlcD gamma) n=1 Tax=[Torrubiella] hemipterigena TaxID=1531966 RepID=A0A0A1T820_9HYPO|nr:Putative HLH transcription factor (GlcD gamma) [[Torrubiella] hemipterigena]